MKGTSVASLVLLALVATWNLDCRVEAQPRAHVQCKKICTQFSKRIPQALLKSYKMTEPSCPKAAVIFVTQKSKEFCADPEASWVKEAVQRLDQTSARQDPTPSSTVSSAAVREEGGIFHRLVAGTVSIPRQAGVLTSPIPGAGTTVSQAVHGSGVRTEEPNTSTLTVQEAMRSSTTPSSALNETGTPPTIYTEPTANGSKVSMRSVDSANKSTGSAMSPATDIPATVPSRFIADPTTAVKQPESPIGPTYKSVGSSRNQTADGPSAFTADATAIVNGTEIAELSPAFLTTAPLESVPSKPAIGLASLGQGSENSTRKPTTVLKGTADATKGSTPQPTPPGGDMGSVSHRSGDERDAVRESMAGASPANYLSTVGREGPPHSSPESISPPGTPVFSFTRFLRQNKAQGASASPDVLVESTPSFLSASRTHTLSLVLLGSVLCMCSAAVWMYVKSRVFPGEPTKEMVQLLLIHQQRSGTNDYAMDAV